MYPFIFISIEIIEKDVCLILIAGDGRLVKTMINELRETYKANTGMDIKIEIKFYLQIPIEEIAGVVVTSKSGKLIVENSLLLRLTVLAKQAIPIIHASLFGPNST